MTVYCECGAGNGHHDGECWKCSRKLLSASPTCFVDDPRAEFEAEGIVARPKTELCTRSVRRLITKIKCRDFVA
jgi:hypothetical protein